MARASGDRRARSCAHRRPRSDARLARSAGHRRTLGHADRLRPGAGRRRLVQFDRRGHLIAAFRWRDDGALAWAKCWTAHGRWIGIEPGTGTHPGWGPLGSRVAARRFRPLHSHRARDGVPVARLRAARFHPAARGSPAPAGRRRHGHPRPAGRAHEGPGGASRVRYRGPYPTEDLFTALLESFRYDSLVTDPLDHFMDGGQLDWLPSPHERHHVADHVSVQLRHDIDKVALHGATFYRRDWQGVIRREPRVVRSEGERTVCSLWALGRSIEDRLVLDRAGEVLEAPSAAPDPPRRRRCLPSGARPWRR